MRGSHQPHDQLMLIRLLWFFLLCSGCLVLHQDNIRGCRQACLRGTPKRTYVFTCLTHWWQPQIQHFFCWFQFRGKRGNSCIISKKRFGAAALFWHVKQRPPPGLRVRRVAKTISYESVFSIWIRIQELQHWSFMKFNSVHCMGHQKKFIFPMLAIYF